MIGIWLTGLLRRRAGRITAVAIGIALTVALLASLGAFLATSQATMTSRAVRSVSVDWQVEVAPGSDPAKVQSRVAADASTTAALPVVYQPSLGFRLAGSGTVQQTGPGVILGLPAHYSSTFSDQFRMLTGNANGVLLGQQTAANLHAKPGSSVDVQLPGGKHTTVRIDGVVEMPQANSLFQKVGAPSYSQPAAPPDNVLIVGASQLHKLLAPLGPQAIAGQTTQIHVQRSHGLASSPATAYTDVSAAAKNLEVKLAGGGTVADNLGAALDAARSDAQYAQVLFLFLGVPGAILAAMVTASVAGAGAARRRREEAMLRTRGASARAVLTLTALEAGLTGAIGVVAGLASAAVVGQLAFGSVSFGPSSRVTLWFAIAAVVGLAVSFATILLPVRRDLRENTIASGRVLGRTAERAPLFARWGIDLALIAAGAATFWAASLNGYSLVLVPEGVPQISVSYWALAAPLLIWIGGALFAWRLVDLLLRRGQPLLRGVLRPLAGNVTDPLVAAMGRQRGIVIRASVLLALALSFAISASTFNTTYAAQSEVDAQLTNGADVAVTQSPSTLIGRSGAGKIAATPGVRSVAPMQHRYAYVGNDLQDIYGVNAKTFAGATKLQDAYFAGGTAAGLMAKLQATKDGVLVSQETVKDFQLQPNTRLTLRLQDGKTHQYVDVPFHYIGVAKEFPTAPKDSFLVANASYIAAMTHSDAVGTFLVDTGGTHVVDVASRLRTSLGTSATVTNIDSVRGQIGTSLTSVDLSGLTRIELVAALLLSAAAGGLLLAIGLSERRRTFAIASAVGARGRHLSGFVTTEAATVLFTGTVLGCLLGAALARTLVSVLTGVFDPPPEALSIPWAYLTVVVISAGSAIALASVSMVRWARTAGVDIIRQG